MTSSFGHSTPRLSDIVAEIADLTPIAGFRGLDVYRFSGNDYPSTLREIGKLREVGFRSIGGGLGIEYDLDDLDTGDNAYFQLIAWDPREKQLVAVYRYQLGWRVIGEDVNYLRTANLFDYSYTFRKKILPYAMELGRSVVNPSAKLRRFGFFAIWKGLGALLRMHPETHYFFGTVSLRTNMNPVAVNCLISYLQHHYPPPEPMLMAKKEIVYHPMPEKADIAAPVEKGDRDIPENRIRKLTGLMTYHRDTMPSILKSYMGLSNKIWFGESVIDHDFGDAYVIGIIVPIQNINFKFRKLFM